MVDQRTKWANVKVDNDIFDIVRRYSQNCPRLLQLLVSGVKGSDWEERLYKPISTKVCVDMALRFWRYADFELDYMLAQQFNFEVLILDKAL
jgi:hypothetical protein